MNRRTIETSEFLETIQELNRQKRFVEVLKTVRMDESKDIRFSNIVCRSQIHFEIGYACYWTGNYTKAHSHVRAASKMAALAGRFDLVGSYKNLNGLILQNLGRATDAIEEFNESYVLRKNSRQNADIYGSLAVC